MSTTALLVGNHNVMLKKDIDMNCFAQEFYVFCTRVLCLCYAMQVDAMNLNICMLKMNSDDTPILELEIINCQGSAKDQNKLDS